MTVGLVFNTRPLRAGPVSFKSLLYSKGLAQHLAHSRSSVNSMGRKERKKKRREGGRRMDACNEKIDFLGYECSSQGGKL